MPDAPMKPSDGPSAAPAEASEGEPGGGSISEVLVATDKSLFQINQLVSQNPQVPDEVKSAFQAALEAYRQGLTALTGGGGSAPAGPGGPQGPATPEQGASGAQPMSMQRPK